MYLPEMTIGYLNLIANRILLFRAETRTFNAEYNNCELYIEFDNAVVHCQIAVNIVHPPSWLSVYSVSIAGVVLQRTTVYRERE